MRRTNLIGKGMWEYRETPESGTTISGTDKEWHDKEAIRDSLVAVLPEHLTTEGTFTYYEWQEIGRRIDRVPIRTT